MALATATAVSAQQPIPPTHYATDERGVDLTTGGYFPFVTEVVIGQPGAGGLVYGRSHIGTGWRDSLLGTVNTDGAPTPTVTVSIGGFSDQFIDYGGIYAPYNPSSSATLTYASGVYTYTTSTGVVATFANTWVASTTPYLDNLGLVTSITSPDGEQLTYTYVTANMCANSGCSSTTPYARLQSVTNNAGYQIKYQYVQDGTAFATRANWLRVLRVTGLNNGVDYCDPSANTCTFSTTWPSVQYATVNSTTATATDEMSRSTTYRNDTSGRITGIRWPGSSADNVTVAYGGDGLVDSVTDATGAWTYDFVTVGSELSAEVSGPDGQGFRALSENGNGMIQAYYDVDNNVTYILWNAPGQPSTITRPDGSSTEFTYDGRGNVTEHREIAAGSGLADLVTTATYPSTCANLVTCNLPLTTTDTAGNVTDYVWDSTHGGLLSVTGPEPSGGADRPQTRIDYDQVYAWYRNSGGTIVQASTPIWRPVETSACAVGEAPACLGTAEERLTTITYGAPSVMNNLLPTTVTVGSGDAAIVVTTTSTYTDRGDVAEVDGPLSGTGDLTRFLYNLNRELIGAIGPDPDGGGGLANRAVRITRNDLGLATLTEQGTTPGYTDSNWASFSPLQQVAVGYDGWGRALSQRVQASSTTFSLVQFSYDASGRLDCAAQRMNPSSFASPPAACTAATPGSFGPDRISRTAYDDFSRVSSVISGYGTADAITESLTYTMGGQVETMTDGEGNLTTWAYDGFGRPWRMYYPNPTSSGSSTTDYEQLTYDAYGRMTASRTRDNQSFGYAYDDLGRLTDLDAPAPMLDQEWAYDNFGQAVELSASGGQTIERTYDALGRMTAEDGPLGAVGYLYDPASRLTRITWPDTYYAAYDFDLTGAMTSVREYGAGSGAGVLAQYAYDDLGRRASTTRGNGAVSAYGWDGASRLTSLSIDLASTGQDATWTLDYNPAGQVIERTLSNTAYAYTAAASLSDAYTNDGLNRVTAVDLTSVTYDGRFNITGDGTSTWSYDASNRLTGSGTASFTFDPVNRLYSSTLSSTTNRFQYAGSQIIATYDGTGALIERYVPGAGLDDYAAWTAGTGGGIMRQWPVTDPLGSVVGLTNGSNVATQINSYDEYGIPASGNAGRFGYAGSMFLPQAGVAPWHMRNRQYHPELGRFLQTDPIGIAGGVNLYAFVGGDPVNWVDPWGLQQGQPEPHDCRGPVAPLGCFPEDNVDEVVVVGNCNIWCQIRRFFGRLGRGDRGDDPALPDLGVPTEYCPLDERLNLFDPEEDPEMYDRGNLATNPVPGSFMVTGHGNPSGVYGPGGRVTGSQLAGMIQRQPGYSPGQTIVIASCRVGQGSTPQIVANSTGSCVVAPTGYAWFGASGGAPYSAFDTPERGPEGQRRPGRPAGWRTVCPE